MSAFRCVIHGSLRKHLKEMAEAMETFRRAGIDVLAPRMDAIVKEDDGFLFFRGEELKDPRLVELLYLRNLRRLGERGFSYFVNPEGYVGRSVSYELGIAQATNVPCFFLRKPSDHPAYVAAGAVLSPEELVARIRERQAVPSPYRVDRSALARLWRNMLVPGSVIATGAIIEHVRPGGGSEVLLVRTHKWRDRFSIVGGKVRRGERLDEALRREIMEETGLEGAIGEHLCTFDQIRRSGYHDAGVQHVFVDHVFRVDRTRVVLNEEAQEYVWLPAREALRALDIEPNARHTLELYAARAA